MSNADRQRRSRERQKNDLIVLPLEIQHHRLAEAAIVSEFLNEEESKKRDNLSALAQAIINEWITGFIGRA